MIGDASLIHVNADRVARAIGTVDRKEAGRRLRDGGADDHAGQPALRAIAFRQNDAATGRTGLLVPARAIGTELGILVA